MKRALGRLGRAGVLLVLAGCAGPALRQARTDLSAGNYPAAHRELLEARAAANLPEWQRREIDNDLCRVEHQIGAPSYPLNEQDQVCLRAAREGAGASAVIAAEVETERRDELARAIPQALAGSDLAEAEREIGEYAALPGADQGAIRQWSQQLWAAIKRQDEADAKAERGLLRPAILQVARRYPEVHRMSEAAFAAWVEHRLTIDGAPLVSRVSFDRRRLTLELRPDKAGVAALNLDRFAVVNDGLVARCACPGETNVAFERNDLPAYLVRFDPALRQSAILVLAGP